MTTRSIGLRELEPAVPDELGDELRDVHDLEVVGLREVAGIVFGEADVVVRVEDDDPLRADRPPVGDVVGRQLPRGVEVAHLCRRPAAAPLFAHQAELDTRHRQQLGGRARDARPVEGRLAVDEQDRLASDRQIEPLCPAGHVLLGDRDVDDRLVLLVEGGLHPALPVRLLHARLDRQRPHRLDDLHGLCPVAVEVTG